MNNQIIPANQDVVNLRNLLTVYHSHTDSIAGYGLYHAMLNLEITEQTAIKVLDIAHPNCKTHVNYAATLHFEFSNGIFDSQTELGRRQINAVLEVINELQPENLFDNSFGFD